MGKTNLTRIGTESATDWMNVDAASFAAGASPKNRKNKISTLDLHLLFAAIQLDALPLISKEIPATVDRVPRTPYS